MYLLRVLARLKIKKQAFFISSLVQNEPIFDLKTAYLQFNGETVVFQLSELRSGR